MYAQVEKAKESKSQTTTNSVTQKRNATQNYQNYFDNRTNTAVQKKWATLGYSGTKSIQRSTTGPDEEMSRNLQETSQASDKKRSYPKNDIGGNRSEEPPLTKPKGGDRIIRIRKSSSQSKSPLLEEKKQMPSDIILPSDFLYGNNIKSIITGARTTGIESLKVPEYENIIRYIVDNGPDSVPLLIDKFEIKNHNLAIWHVCVEKLKFEIHYHPYREGDPANYLHAKQAPEYAQFNEEFRYPIHLEPSSKWDSTLSDGINEADSFFVNKTGTTPGHLNNSKAVNNKATKI